MATPTFDQLLEAGCHFGHLKRKWNPAMAPYIFMERNGIHIIDLYKTAAKLDEAAAALKNIAKAGKKVLFVATKKQAKQVIADKKGNLKSVVLSTADGEETMDAELLLIASGFSGTEDYNDAMRKADTSGKVLYAGDMKTGATLVVLAEAEGKRVAAEADEMLMGYTSLK